MTGAFKRKAGVVFSWSLLISTKTTTIRVNLATDYFYCLFCLVPGELGGKPEGLNEVRIRSDRAW